MRIFCVGTNHKRANVAVREKLAFDADELREALNDLRRRWPDEEFAVLSTCNRTEVYAARPKPGQPRVAELSDWLGEFHSLPKSQYANALYVLADAQAVGHLFAVAAGLDSLVPGEAQIVGQVKAAYARAVDAGCARAVMNDLFQGAFHVAKHIRSETSIAVGKVSVASVAVEFVRQLFETLEGKCVLNVGAGKMNDLMLRQLRDLGARRLVIVNRSRQRADHLAASHGAEAGDFSRLGDHLAQADVVLTSTGAAEPILSAEQVRSAQERRRWRPLLIVDIAVPRDVDPAADELDNVFLYNIDDLERIVQSTLAMRQSQQDAAQGIIDEHVEQMLVQLNVRKVAPTIEALYRRMEQIAARELDDARNKLSTHDDAEEDMEILRRALHRTIRQFLHPCAQRLRQAAESHAAGSHIATIHELFGLDEEEDPPPG